jgi:hypothetical protein
MIKSLEDICEEGRYDHNQDRMGEISSESSRAKITNNNRWINEIVSGGALDDANGDDEEEDDEGTAAQLFQ